MILVTLGTQKEQFTRLLDCIENSNIDDEIIVQAGYTKYKSKKMKIFDFIPYEEMSKLEDKADLVITHAGTGSIIGPLKKGKKVIACARLKKYGEHVDDHQLQLIEVFKDENYILELNENNNLNKLYKDVKKFKPKTFVSNTDKFIKKLKNNIKHKKIKNINWFKNIKLEYIVALVLLFTFYFISKSIPLTGDDWTNSLYKTTSISKIIEIALQKYMQHEGRFFSRIFVLFFCNAKWIWNIINAVMISSMYLIIHKIINVRDNKAITLILPLVMILLPNEAFTQCLVWVTGNSTYALPMFLVIIYFYYLNETFNTLKFNNKFLIIFNSVIIILASIMVENVSAALLFANFILNIYYFYKNKKISGVLLLYFMLSLLGFLVIVLSPGATLRLATQCGDFNKLNIFEKVYKNIPNFINYTFIKNSSLLVLLMIAFYKVIVNNIKGIKKWILLIMTSIVPLLTVLYNIAYLFSPVSSKTNLVIDKLNIFSKSNNIFVILYWIMLLLLLIYFIIKYINRDKEKCLFYLFVGLSSNLAMLLSPIWGGRTTLFCIYMMNISLLIVLNNYGIINFKKAKILTLGIINILVVLFLIILYKSVSFQQGDRERSIALQIKNNNSVVEFDRFPNYALWNSNAWNSFHEAVFKEYYGVSSDCVLLRKNISYKYGIFYKRR